MEGKWIWTTVIVVVIVIIAAVGAYYFTRPSGEEEKVLVVATSADFPPFEYIDPDTQEITGFDVELIKMIGEKIGYKIEMRNMAFDSLIPSLQTGKVDVVIAALTITEEREQVIDFSKPYWHADQAIVARKDSNIVINSPEDLKGKVIGASMGTTGFLWVKDNIGEDECTLNAYSSFVDAVQALVSGQVDLVIMDTTVVSSFEKSYDIKQVYTVETGENYGIAIQEGNTELLNKINQALDEIMNSPEWDQLVEKYFG